jgi:hypothetical protein
MLTPLRFAAVLLTALSLIPACAHLFELPNKIGLPREAYFIAQGLYRGWALFGFAIIGAMAANLALAVAQRRQRRAVWLALGAGLLIGLTLAIFFTWVYPANVAMANWTQAPPDWEALRRHWEYGHAVNALLTFLAFSLSVLSVLGTERHGTDRP